VVTDTVTGCKDSITYIANVLSDSVTGGGGGGLESESLGGLVSKRDFNYLKNSIDKHYNYAAMQPVQSGNHSSRTTVSSGSILKRLVPASMDANTSAYEASPSDITDITRAVDVYALDYVSNNHAKAVALGITTLGKVYNHTKSVCDRFRGASLVTTQTVNIQGYNFIQFALQKEDGIVEYCIAFDAGKSAGRNTFALQTNWLISQYAGDDSVFNFQAWAADPANTVLLVNKILNNLSAIMPLQQTDTRQSRGYNFSKK
jgi:hypothetical protein